MNNPETASTLNDLIETCKDGEYGFRTCAEKVNSSQLATLFLRRADDCRRAAAELQEQVVMLGGKPDTGGTVGGALHRGWVSVRDALATYDDLAVVKECERGEDLAVSKYREALEKPLPEPIRTLVENQYQGARRNYVQVCAIRQEMNVNV